MKRILLGNDRSALRGKKVSAYPASDLLYLATSNVLCPKAEVKVKAGEAVTMYQLLGVRHGDGFDEPILSPCSGTYLGLEKHLGENGRPTDYLKIQNDHQDALSAPIAGRNLIELERLSRSDMASLLKAYGVLDRDGVGKPVYLKLSSPSALTRIVVDATEETPSEHEAGHSHGAEVLEALKLLLQALECSEVDFMVAKGDLAAFHYYSVFLRELPGVSGKVYAVEEDYPERKRARMVQMVTKEAMKIGVDPMLSGVALFTLGTLVDVDVALKENHPVLTHVVSVVGKGLVESGLLRVRTGASVKEIVAALGGYSAPAKPKVLVVGDPMKAPGLSSDDTFVQEGTRRIEVSFAHARKPESCIRCGECLNVCPAGLNPIEIVNTMKTMPVDKAKVKLLNPTACIECGLCTYVCPSKINVTDEVKRAKMIARLP